jgi:hypothetical protein
VLTACPHSEVSKTDPPVLAEGDRWKGAGLDQLVDVLFGDVQELGEIIRLEMLIVVVMLGRASHLCEPCHRPRMERRGLRRESDQALGIERIDRFGGL